MTSLTDTPLSILDLSTIGSGQTASSALRQSVELAKKGESLGYKRHWLAEHHGMPSVATSTPEIMIAHVAQATDHIRVGSGGIMLPNHAPLKVAESFHTLEALFPGRIDLGIGRAPGTDQTTQKALRSFDANQFPAQLDELQRLSSGDFPADHPFASVTVMPNDVELPPIWLLGSSGASAKFAGQLGLGYSFASHFSQTDPRPALDAYRNNFQPSARFEEPHIIMATAVICAETDEQANHLAASWDLATVRLRRGEYSPFPTPEEAKNYPYTAMDRAIIDKHRKLQFVGSQDTVRTELEDFTGDTGADELMIATFVHSHEDRIKSIELLADAFDLDSN